MLENKKYKAIDLFSGAGGMSLGFQNAGFEILLAMDNDSHCSKTYKRNFKNTMLVCEDIKEISSNRIIELLNSKPGDLDVVMGGPPCQGFSSVNAKTRFIENPKNILFKQFVRVINDLKPKYFVMENVVGLTTMENGAIKKEILDSFEDIGYKVKVKVLDAVDYGVPQFRKRAFFIGNNLGLPIKFPIPSHGKDAQQTLLSTEKGLKPYATVGDALRGIEDDSNIPNHDIPNHDDKVLERMSFVPEGGTQKDIPEECKPPQRFKNTYGRLNRQNPSFTIHTRFDVASTGSLFHPIKNRALTVREGARIQSFPDDFVFEGPKSSQYRQVGNAVPPKLAEAIATVIVEILSKSN